MFNYYAFGLSIASQIELPGLIKTSGKVESDVKILNGKFNLPLETIVESRYYFVDNEDVYLWWDEIGKVKISDGNQIIVDVKNNEYKIIPFLLGPAMTILLHQRGYLVLHGSSIKINGTAIVFLGYRGIGKSTTAINLYKKGYPLITDDILSITFDEYNKPYIHPGYIHVRLTEESYNHIKNITNILTPIRTIMGKLFCDASKGFNSRPMKLEKIYLLEEGYQTRLSILNSQEMLFYLIKHSTASRIFKEKDQANNLIQCANLINNVKLSRLEVKHSFKDISKLITIIENDYI